MTITVVDETKLDNNKILRLVKGDITERDVDVIVNAANSYQNMVEELQLPL